MCFKGSYALVVGAIFLAACASSPTSQDYDQELEFLQIDPVEYGQRLQVSKRENPGDEKEECECGLRRGKSEKIVGGIEAEKNEFPWRCALYYNNSVSLRFFCGCSVLNNEWIMTAAHCTKATKGFPLFVNAGDHDLTKDTDTKNQFVEVGEVHQHPDYNSTNYNNDISLLKLSRPLEASDTIGPVCVPYKYSEEGFSNTSVIASGWGTLQEGAPTTPSILHKVDLPVLSSGECKPFFNKGQINDKMLCTYNPGKDTCQGDSGGSIDYKDPETGRYFAIGVVSFGYGCARDQRPGVYTNVAKYTDYIDETTGVKLCRA